MIKRLLAILALGAVFAACSPAADDTTTSPGTDTSPAAPSESVEASPSAS